MTEPRKPRQPRKAAAPKPEIPEVVAEVADEPAIEAEAPVEPVEALEAEPVPAPETEPVAPPAAPQQPRRSALALEFRRTLQQGDHGPAVDRVMEALSAKGFYEGPVDGRYGTRLARCIRQFQQANGLRVTGSVNVTTWEAILK